MFARNLAGYNNSKQGKKILKFLISLPLSIKIKTLKMSILHAELRHFYLCKKAEVRNHILGSIIILIKTNS